MSAVERRFEKLTEQAEQAFVEGNLEVAAELLLQAEQIAHASGHSELADQAFCRRSYLLIELEQLDDELDLKRLQKILLSSTVPKTQWMAAYYAGMAYYVQGQPDKALTYVRRSTELASDLGDSNCTAASANLQGNLELIGSHFLEAEECYASALAHFDASGSFQEIMWAQLNDNLGYVYLCTDRPSEGVKLCERARETMEHAGAEHFLHQVLQDLCYGYLLLDEFELAHENGERGLQLALALDDKLVTKNLYYLLAEVAIRSGDRFRARRFLSSLADCYPGLAASDEIVEILMGADFTQVVNLRG